MLSLRWSVHSALYTKYIVWFTLKWFKCVLAVISIAKWHWKRRWFPGIRRTVRWLIWNGRVCFISILFTFTWNVFVWKRFYFDRQRVPNWWFGTFRFFSVDWLTVIGVRIDPFCYSSRFLLRFRLNGGSGTISCKRWSRDFDPRSHCRATVGTVSNEDGQSIDGNTAAIERADSTDCLWSCCGWDEWGGKFDWISNRIALIHGAKSNGVQFQTIIVYNMYTFYQWFQINHMELFVHWDEAWNLYSAGKACKLMGKRITN